MTKSIIILFMGFFSFLSNAQNSNYQIDKSNIIVSQNINFHTQNEQVFKRLREVFGASSDYYSKNEHKIICQLPTISFGYYLLDNNIDLIVKSIGTLKIAKYYQNVLSKKTEEWKRIDDKPTRIFYDSINPKEITAYLDYIINQQIDSTKYVWILDSPIYHPEDNYKGLYCKFSTSHSNPKWDWEFNLEKKDFCKVTEKYKDEAVEWIPLAEGKEIKADKITLTAKKIYIDEKLKDLAISLKKMCEIAIEFNLELSKDNDG